MPLALALLLAGTVAVVILAIAVVVARARFQRRVNDEARALLARASRGAADKVRAEELERLPAPVRRWLEVSGVVGRERARTIRLKQRGQMRTAPDQAWMPVRAEQYFTIDEPAFLWRVEATMMRVLPIDGRDRYLDGKGHMLIKAAGLVTVADGKGDKIDQGTLLRYLGEIVWFPSAALCPFITWGEIDERHAKATMSHGGVTASAIFTFDDKGRVFEMSADRYLGSTGTLERWIIPATEWRVIDGVEVPVRGDAIWKLATGDFNYYRWEILEVEQNQPRLYAEDAAAPDAGGGRPMAALSPRHP